jgi:hypothetical protein
MPPPSSWSAPAVSCSVCWGFVLLIFYFSSSCCALVRAIESESGVWSPLIPFVAVPSRPNSTILPLRMPQKSFAQNTKLLTHMYPHFSPVYVYVYCCICIPIFCFAFSVIFIKQSCILLLNKNIQCYPKGLWFESCRKF